jgi:hypothetical protein
LDFLSRCVCVMAISSFLSPLPLLLTLFLSIGLILCGEGDGRRVANMEWCEEAPIPSYAVDVKDAYVLVNEKAHTVSFGVDMSFQSPSSSLSFPDTFYRLSVWEEETGEKDRIRKGNIWEDFEDSMVEGVEGGREGWSRVRVRGHVTRTFAARETNYEVTFGLYTTHTHSGSVSVEDVVCFIVKFHVASSQGHTRTLSPQEL